MRWSQGREDRRPRVVPEAVADSPRAVFLQRVVVGLLAVVILGFSLWGFGTKFLEFVELARGEPDGLFAVTPVVNYLLASAGFFCLLLWATLRGMFRDIERPKYEFLENEARLDAGFLPAAGPAQPPRRTR